MKGVKRIILSFIMLLCLIATGTQSALSHNDLRDVSHTLPTESSCSIQQVETPLERTMKVIYLNSKADLSQTVGQVETQEGNSGRIYLTNEADCFVTNGTVTAKIDSKTPHQQCDRRTGTDYYVYTLRRILR